MHSRMTDSGVPTLGPWRVRESSKRPRSESSTSDSASRPIAQLASPRRMRSSSVRKEGVEPSPQLRDRNLNRDVDELSAGNHGNSLRQEMSESVEQRHLSGRSGPVLEMLAEARECWATVRSPSGL